MRWEALFRDLEAQAQAQADDQWLEEVGERARGERLSVSIASRVAAARGTSVAVVMSDGSRVRGDVRDSGSDWVLLADAGRQRLVSLTAVSMIEGLARRADQLTVVESRLTMARTLRALSRERARVTVRAGIEISGVIVAVGEDHVDLATDRGVAATVPILAILEVSSADSSG